MFAKLPSYYSLEHEFLISFALQVQLPADNHAVVERNQTSLGPTFLSERGMGDLPHWRELIADNESPTDESGQAPNPIVQLQFGGWSLPVLLSRAAGSR